MTICVPVKETKRSCLHGKRGKQVCRFSMLACVASGDGLVNFRMRAMVMSVASYHLWLDWRAAGTRLGRLFTDYEPGIHWSQVQMQSGITGMNSIRIYNPMKQAVEHDPNGAFVRRWCPELRDVPDVFARTLEMGRWEKPPWQNLSRPRG